jgi:hypothetical protein
VPRETKIIDKTKDKIEQPAGDLTRNKRLKREDERNERKARSKAR